MQLQEYLGGLLSEFKQSQTVSNIKELVKGMIAEQTNRLWRIASDKAGYKRYKRLLDGSLKSVVDEETSAEALREKSVAKLSEGNRVIMLHDPCDIRKGEAKKMEKLGKVRDLDGGIINGYSTFNSVGVLPNSQAMYPLDITVYSNREERYVTVSELKAYEQGKLSKQVEPARASEVALFVEQDEYINLPRLSQTQMRRVSEALKSVNPYLTICHVIDRQFDGVNYFEFIHQELEDEFVIRVKVSRNANQIVFDEETGKEVTLKLVDVPFDKQTVDVLDKLRLNKQLYQQAKRRIEWGTLTLNGHDYTIVRVTLFDRHGNPLFENPIILITNIAVSKAHQARAIYLTYLMRAKIEALFKFIKEDLGWEDFQVRDFISIKNIIALTYFVGGYFYHSGSDLARNPIITLIAQLGGGKGNVSRHFFLIGLKLLLIHQAVEQFLDSLDQHSLDELQAFIL